jgi:protein TIF31
MEDVAGSLSNLLLSSSKEIKCVESIVFSSFNPAPSYRRWIIMSICYTFTLLCTVKSLWLFFSLWKPCDGVFVDPRLVGDLIYLDVVTLEGNKFCITGTTKMFYVNSSTSNCLDPRPSKTNFEAATLAGLLQKISPKFKKGNIAWFKHFILLKFEVG